MTSLLVVMALPFVAGMVAFAFLAGPLIYRAGARSVQRSTARDNAEIARILDGLQQARPEPAITWARPAPPALPPAPTAAHASLRVATSPRSLHHQPRHARGLVMAHLAADTYIGRPPVVAELVAS